MSQTVRRQRKSKPIGLVNFWNDALVPQLFKYQHVLVGGLSRHSAAVMPALGIEAGVRVLDVGCGFGDTALQIADRVGPTGSVLGVDRCQRFLNIARQRAEFSFCTNVKFIRQHAEPHFDEAAFDFVFARFGTLYFAHPVAGLRTMRKALKPGGRVAHIVWRPWHDNPWLFAARDTVLKFLSAQEDAVGMDAPGQFLMSDEATSRTQMEAAGYTDVQFQRIDVKVLVGRSVTDAIAFQLALGSAGEAFREAGQHALDRRAEIEAALARLFDGVESDRQGLWMDSSSWLITGRAPEATTR